MASKIWSNPRLSRGRPRNVLSIPVDRLINSYKTRLPPCTMFPPVALYLMFQSSRDPDASDIGVRAGAEVSVVRKPFSWRPAQKRFTRSTTSAIVTYSSLVSLVNLKNLWSQRSLVSTQVSSLFFPNRMSPRHRGRPPSLECSKGRRIGHAGTPLPYLERSVPHDHFGRRADRSVNGSHARRPK